MQAIRLLLKRENVMTSFVNPDYPRTHAGAERIEALLAALQGLRDAKVGAKGIATLILAGGVSALLLLADQILGSWTDEHLLIAWALMWALVFAALAMLGSSARHWSIRALAAYEAGIVRRARRAADQRFWQAALEDPRVMVELRCAYLRAESEALANGEAPPKWPFPEASAYQLSARQLFRGDNSSWLNGNPNA